YPLHTRFRRSFFLSQSGYNLLPIAGRHRSECDASCYYDHRGYWTRCNASCCIGALHFLRLRYNLYRGRIDIYHRGFSVDGSVESDETLCLRR
ncbi:hypothetical protein PFISCL1PPCAC_5438, partial [Pristionchus fissidentatus]